MTRHFFAALLCAAAPLATPAIASTAPAAQVTSQLPRNAKPVHYAIRVTPEANSLGYSANVAITIDLLVPSESVTLNAADIKFAKAAIRPEQSLVTGASAISAAVTSNDAAQTATIAFGKKLPAGRYILDIDYGGKIYQQANGLFALDYKDVQGDQKRALFTQFEAPDARRFVPSWDEPNYKATFDLSAIVPSDQMAVSNMPVASRKDLGGGKSEVIFGTSPKMSTYLLFFGLGEFDRITKHVGPTEVGVVMGKGNAAKGQYALDASAKVVEYYNDYFGTPYPLPKLDNVAGPGQSQFFGAMENWGAIFTFERILLVDPKITSARAQQRIFSTGAHEIAHQWFGNLVTMQWWDDLWLNEGFASWMESKATTKFNPEWQAELDRVESRDGAIALDAYATTHPIIQTIKTVEQTSQAFDTITYSKGQAVITMLEGFAGEDVWRNGIRGYMRKHAYGNTRTDDLWNAVEGAGATGLTKIAHDFTRQPGVPLIKISDARCVGGQTIINMTQGEFSRDRKQRTDANPQRWNVPVIGQILGHSSARAIVSKGKGRLTVPGCGTLLVNAGQSGYYRVLYTPATMAALRSDFAKLPALDQAGLMGNSSSLSAGGYQPMSIILDLIDAIPATASQAIVEQAADGLGSYHELFKEDAPRQAKMATIANARFGPLLDRLGMAQKANEPFLDANLRSALIRVLGGMDNAKVKAEARRLFDELERNPAALDGPLRTTWLGIIAYNADRPTWDKLRMLGQKAESEQVKSTLYRLLGAGKDKALAAEALKLALTPEPGATTSAAIISAVSKEHPEMAVDFALANLESVLALVDVSSRSEFVAQLAVGSDDAVMPAKLEAYAQKHLTADSRKPVDQAIVAINTRIKDRPRIRSGVAEWLDKKP